MYKKLGTAKESFTKEQRDEYLTNWQNHMKELVDRFEDDKEDSEELLDTIHWCLYFAGKRESMT